MSFAVALFPVILYIFVVYTLDNFSLVGIRDLMLLVGAGLLAAAACFGLFRLTDPFVSERVSDSLYPIMEEASSLTASFAERPWAAVFPSWRISCTC